MVIEPKKINYDVLIKSTNHTRSYSLPPEVYTSDTAVQFRFNILDVEPAEFVEGAAVSTVEITTRDGSFFQHVGETALEGTTVIYDLKEAEGKHAGLAKIQLKINLGGDYFTSDEYEFKILNSISTGVPVEIYVQNWDTLTAQANAYLTKMAQDIEEFDVALETGVLATNIAAKLLELSTQFAPDLLAVKAQLEQTVLVSNTASQKADAMASGSPKGVYATLASLQAAYPTGTTGAYLVTADGKWYYWSGSVWTAGGIYQGVVVPDGSLTLAKIDPSLRVTKYPFSSEATLIRDIHKDTPFQRGAIRQFSMFAIKSDDFYIKDLYSQHTHGKFRKVYIVNSAATEYFSYQLINPGEIPPTNIETINMTSNLGGTCQIIVDWSKVYTAIGVDMSINSHRLDNALISRAPQDASLTGSKLALNTVTPDRIRSFKPVGIIVGDVTINTGAGRLTVGAGTQALLYDYNGGVEFIHLCMPPDYLPIVYNLDFSGGARAIMVDMATKAFISVPYVSAVTYRDSHRLFGILYSGKLLGGDTDNAFVTTIISGTTTYKESKIIPKSITGLKLADATIDGSKIAPSVVTNGHMADSSIGTPELIDLSVTSVKIANDTISGRKLAPGTMARNYPLSSNALGYRSRLNDSKNVVWGDSVHQLFFNGKKDRYYIEGFWGKHGTTSSRALIIKSEDGTDTVSFGAPPTYDGEGLFVYPSKEYCVLKDSSNAVRGFAVVSWGNTAQVPDYKFVDTEIHASCFINTVKLKDTLNLTFTEDYGVVFHLDSKYHATVGREFNIYFDAIVATKKPEDVYYSVSASGITYPSLKHFDECVRLMAVTGDIGDKTLTIQVKKMSTGETIATASTILSIRADTALSTPIKALFLGDSLTAAGTIQNTAKDMFGANFTLYGTRGAAPYLQEGRSSWSANEYLTIAEKGGVVNPFFNPVTSLFDFAYYMSNNPTFADVDVVNVFLGRNDGYNGLATANKIKQIVDNIHAFNPDIIVTVMSAYHTGATNAGTGQYLQNTWGFRQGTFSYNAAAKPVFEGREAERTFLIPQHVNLDTVYDYPHSNLQVSARNTETVYRITDNVHPNSFGYMKMADVWYNWMQYIRTLITI